MFTSFSVKNFKSIRDSGKIEVRPLTIFIGPNNSGKSSLLQFLLALKQTIEARDTESPFSTRQREGYVDIGGYEDFIFLHDKEKALSFKLYFEEKTDIETESVIRYKQEEIYLDSFVVEIDGKTIRFNSRGEFEQNFVNENLLSEIIEKYGIPEGKMTLFRKEKFYYVSEFLTYRIIPSLEMLSIRKKIEREVKSGVMESSRAGFNNKNINEREEEEIIKTKKTISSLINLQRELFTTFNDLFYLGPLREHPQRYYFVSGEKPIHVGTRGERAVEVLFVTSKTSKGAFQRVNFWFKKLGFGEISFGSLAESLYTLNVTHPTIKRGFQNLEVNIASVGFGASQILPVIVEGFYAPRNAIILIEQPEIHLHPKLQAEMGDLLIDVAKTGKRLIVETHSEHVLMRIQRRIAEGSINTDDVAVYYFEQEKEGTKITQLNLDRFGQFTNWPKGFFEEDLMEAYEHSKAIAEKLEAEGRA
ncbi:MAG: DUF3696 domain-containing protein [Theionarchaea archaeon]|nr:DUF3696 domain-containing protein [Theionarchaea archaeon]